MASLKSKFDKAVKDSKTLPEPDNMTLLKIYALYKQASSMATWKARAQVSRPRRPRQVDAWNELKGTCSEDAMQAYVDLIESLK